MRKDNHSDIVAKPAITPRAIAANTLINTGTIFDCQDFKSLELILSFGTITDGTYTPILTVGNLSNLADGAPAPAADLLGTLALATFALAADSNKTKRFGYKGEKRYARLDLQPSGVTTGSAGFSAVGVQGHPLLGPQP